MDFVCLMSKMINHEHILWSACDKRSIISSTGAGMYSRCTRAFLFSMINPHGHEPMQIPLTPGGQKYGIFCYSDFGPTFGGSLDRKQFTLKIYSYLQMPLGESNDFDSPYHFPPERETFFTGTSKFQLSDYEVFLLK